VKVVAVLALVVVAFFAGIMFGRHPSTCVYAPSSVGPVPVCSNDLKRQMKGGM
jgi:hypothetical protein